MKKHLNKHHIATTCLFFIALACNLFSYATTDAYGEESTSNTSAEAGCIIIEDIFADICGHRCPFCDNGNYHSDNSSVGSHFTLYPTEDNIDYTTIEWKAFALISGQRVECEANGFVNHNNGLHNWGGFEFAPVNNQPNEQVEYEIYLFWKDINGQSKYARGSFYVTLSPVSNSEEATVEEILPILQGPVAIQGGSGANAHYQPSIIDFLQGGIWDSILRNHSIDELITQVISSNEKIVEVTNRADYSFANFSNHYTSHWTLIPKKPGIVTLSIKPFYSDTPIDCILEIMPWNDFDPTAIKLSDSTRSEGIALKVGEYTSLYGPNGLFRQWYDNDFLGRYYFPLLIKPRNSSILECSSSDGLNSRFLTALQSGETSLDIFSLDRNTGEQLYQDTIQIKVEENEQFDSPDIVSSSPASDIESTIVASTQEAAEQLHGSFQLLTTQYYDSENLIDKKPTELSDENSNCTNLNKCKYIFSLVDNGAIVLDSKEANAFCIKINPGEEFDSIDKTTLSTYLVTQEGDSLKRVPCWFEQDKLFITLTQLPSTIVFSCSTNRDHPGHATSPTTPVEPTNPEPTAPTEPKPAPSAATTTVKTSLAKASVTVKPKAYTGKTQTCGVPAVKVGGKTLRYKTDFIYTCKAGKKVGSYLVTIKGRGAYAGTAAAKFQIVPKGVSAKKPAAAKRGFTATWARPSSKYLKQTTGYQVSWSTDKRFGKGVKSALVKGAKKTTLKVGKLKAKKTYYVKVRAYKQVGKMKCYSAWSKTQKVKTR